jgi:hypothetical protein
MAMMFQKGYIKETLHSLTIVVTCPLVLLIAICGCYHPELFLPTVPPEHGRLHLPTTDAYTLEEMPNPQCSSDGIDYEFFRDTTPGAKAICPCTFYAGKEEILVNESALIDCSSGRNKNKAWVRASVMFSLGGHALVLTKFNFKGRYYLSECVTMTWDGPMTWDGRRSERHENCWNLNVAESIACAQQIDALTRTVSSGERNCAPIPDFEP